MIIKKMFFSVIIFLIFSQSTLAVNRKKMVNILTWWNYLNYPEISTILKKECDVEIHYDEYFSNTEFLRRFNANKEYYDIIIFSNTIYELLKDKVKNEDSSLSKVAQKYDNCVKKNFLSRKYPHNFALFILSFSGFLWNPEVVTLSKKDTIFSIFKKAKGKTVIVIDDPVEVWTLINHKALQDKKHSETIPLRSQVFKDITKNAAIYVTNGYNKLYNKDSFFASFQWSGDAVFILKNSKKNLKFLIHPDLSYVSSDLLAELNTRPETCCVAKVLASRKVLDVIQEKSYYLSPYGTHKSVTDPTFRYIYDQLKKNMCRLKWLESVSIAKYKDLVKEWHEIQISATVK